MTVRLFIAAALYLSLATGANATAAETPDALNGLMVHEAPKDVLTAEFDGPDGLTSVSAIDAPLTVLNFWATWCAPCVHEMPMLDELANEMDGELRVVTVSQDMKGAEMVEPFFAKGGYTKLEPWLDPKNDLMFGLEDTNVLPTTILYDADGKEVLRVVGGYAWNGAEAKGLVEEAL